MPADEPIAGGPADPLVLSAAVYANSFKTIDRAFAATGFRTHALRFSAVGHTTDPRPAEEFLVNSRLRRHDRENEESIGHYFSPQNVVMLSLAGRSRPHDSGRVRLPRSAPMPMALDEAVRRRRSARQYTGDAMHLEYLAALVRSAAGVTGQADGDAGAGRTAALRFRTAASAGGLYPVDLHLAALNVRGLERGLYRYEPATDCLLRAGGRPDVERLLGTFAVPDDAISVGRANVLLLLVGLPWRSMRKYGSRGLRFAFLEAGAMAHGLALAAVALGFGSVDCASVYDDEAHEVLGLDGVSRALLHTVVVGCVA